MDQTKIGAFIAKERKRKKLTQKQLAEKLDISDKTISKWERGNGFPEVSLLLPLCTVLEITVNELLSGERVSEEDYLKRAEENMVNMIREKEENARKMMLIGIIGIMATVSFVTLLLVVCVYTDVIALPVKIVLISIACVIFGVGIVIALEGNRTIGYFKCGKCGELFVPDVISYNSGLNIVTARYLKCPKCGEKSFCKKHMSQGEQK